MDGWDSSADDSFYVTLVSNLCLDYFVDNTSANFRNILWKPITLSEPYLCALCSIDYGDDFSFNRIQAHPKYPDGPSPEGKWVLVPKKSPETVQTTTTEAGIFFGTDTDESLFFGTDNTITIQKESINEISLTKLPDEHWANFLTKVKTVLNRLNLVTIATNYDGKDEYPSIVLSVQDPKKEEYFLKISSELATFLGFTREVFHPGRYEAPNKVSEEGYLLISDGKVECYLNRWITSSIPIENPKASITNKVQLVEEVIEECVLSMNEKGYNLSMSVSLDGILSIEFDSEQTTKFKFRFPKKFNKLLGLDEDFFIESNLEIILDERTLYPNPPPTEVELSRKKILSTPIGNQIVVQSDVIEGSIYGPNVRKILRIFDRERGIRIPHRREFVPLQFHRVLSKELTSIQITLSDTNFIPIREVLYPTTVVLLFVKQKVF
jgi:hypothetical protein